MLGMTLGSSKTLPVAHALPLGVDCGDAYNGHCYANQTWGGAIGAKTSITVVPLTCTYSSGACDFIDNEMWLIDDGNLCSFCMVEAGYWNDPFDGHTESYFWGDQTPSGQLLDHFLKYVPQQDYNAPVTISIIKASGIYPSAWYITISGASDTLYAESTDNNMNPTGPHSEIQIGMELGGHNSDYASAPDAWYTNNQWASSSGWNYQTNAGPNGQPSSHNPPNMQMPTKPAPGNNGGRFYTYCCSMADSVMPGSASIPSSAPISPSPVLGLRAIQPGARQANGTMFDTAVVTAYTLSHPIPRSTALGASATPTAVQDVVLGTSQQISQLLGGENMGVPDSTLLYYVKVNGDFAFPTSPDGPEIVSHQAVEVFDATTGNLLIAGS